MKTPDQIKAIFFRADVSEMDGGAIKLGYPARPWTDVPSKGDIRNETGAYAIETVGAVGGKVWFILRNK